MQPDSLDPTAGSNLLSREKSAGRRTQPARPVACPVLYVVRTMGDILKIPVSNGGRDAHDATLGALLRLNAELDGSIARARLLFMGLATLSVPLALLVFLGRRTKRAPSCSASGG